MFFFLSRFRWFVDLLGLWQALKYVFCRLLGVQEISLRLPGIRQPILCRPRHSDMYAFWHVFGHRDCDVELSRPPRLIIDGGANVGYASILLANKYPNARIIAVEPDPKNCALIRRQIVSYSNIQLVEGALWPRPALLAIDNPTADSWAFRVRELDPTRDGQVGQGMRGATISELLNESGADALDLLKLDVEGAEQQLLTEGDLAWLNKLRVMVVETHGPAIRQVVEKVMADHGFVREAKGEKLVYRQSKAAG
ncbi:MAG: FkbM family methyltransferase [Phycisphaeraceae bacterium]|nr:FkbM family methyltransferase [Phycisphaeraceae bacterium]